MRFFGGDIRYTPVNHNEDGEPELGSGVWAPKTLRVASIVLAATAFVAFSGSWRTPANDPLLTEESLLKVSNEYERNRGFPLNDGLIENMVQVHKSTRLELGSQSPAKFFVEESPETGTFKLINEEAKPFVEHIFKDLGVFRVKAEVSKGGEVETHESTVRSKIIRYELRDLSEADRQLYFDTLQEFYFTGQKQGEELYGPQYKSLSYLLREHLYGAADKECDHWHDDAGILTHHVGITWEMETSMRMISPATASHYWDYTREGAQGIDWYDSPIFDDDWFGSNSPSNPDHIVDKGRFAFTPVSNAVGFSKTMNPYGLLRSPWNTNPTPYMLRHNETFFVFADGNTDGFPTCSAFASFLDSSFADVQYALNGELHGPVHIMIGGHWNINPKWSAASNSLGFGDKFLLVSKFLWRQGFVRTPESCSSDVAGEDCMPSCPESITGTVDTSNRAYELLDDSGVIGLSKSITNFHTILKSAGLDWLDLWKELCHVGWPGEMFTSSAPQDPTFWPLHGNAERYVMYRSVLRKWGIVTYDETWGYSHGHNIPSDTGVVCDWSGVTSEVGMPTCVKDTCTGHRVDDLLPFTNLYPKQGDSLLTNAQMLARMDPFHGDLPYAYDSLSYWQGCTDHNLITEYNSIYDQELPVHSAVPYWKAFLSDGASVDAAAEAREKEAILSGEVGPQNSDYRWWGIF